MTPSPNRVWFITGASSSLGQAILEAVLANNERAVATCRNPSVLSSLVEKYTTTKDRLLVQKLDLTKSDEVKAALNAAIDKFGRIDVVVNNAGYGLFGEIEGTPEEEARYEFEVQFWGPANILKEVRRSARIFREVNPKGAGGLVFSISAPSGYRANPTLSYFSASKFALEAFTQAYLQEMTPSWNIRGCIIQPGTFPSDTWSVGNAKRIPHPAYTDPSNPCAKFSSLVNSLSDSNSVIGDTAKMGKALIRLADLSTGTRSEGLWAGFEKESKALGEAPVQLPLRVQFGSDSLFLIGQQAKDTCKNAEEWAWISHSTNMDSVDGQEFVRRLVGSGNFKDVVKE